MAGATHPLRLQKARGGVTSPVPVGDLVSAAEGHGAGDPPVDALRGLPDQEDGSPVQANEAFSQEN